VRSSSGLRQCAPVARIGKGGDVRQSTDHAASSPVASPGERPLAAAADFLVSRSGVSQTIALVDISANGCSLVGTGPIAQGEPVVVRLGELAELGGTVRWVRKRTAAVVFDQTVQSDTLDALRHRLAAHTGINIGGGLTERRQDASGSAVRS